MPTTQAPRVVSRRRASSKGKSTPARRTNRYMRFLKHPINSLWGLFSSLKTAIVIISLIAVVCAIGVIIIQVPAEIASSPSDYSAWVAQEMVPKYGANWANFFNSLGFFSIFSSWYFKVLVVLLAINVAVGGLLSRVPGIWYTFRHPAVRTNDRFYQNALARKEFDTDQDAEGLRRFFRKKHFRVLVKENSETGVTYLYAYKNAWATLSTFVFHTCLVSLMLAAVITGWQGFGQNSMAQRILPAPIYNYLQSVAGFSYTSPLPDGETGLVYPIGTKNNIEYHADDFVANFNQNGDPTDFYTDLTLYQNGTTVAHQRIRVNDPLTYQGVTFHQASFIMYAWITITDDKGNIIFNQKPVLDQHFNVNPNTGSSIPINTSEDIPLSNIQQIMTVSAVYAPDTNTWSVLVTGRDAKGNPTFCGFAPQGGSAPLLDLSQSNLSCSDALAAINLGQAQKLTNWTLNVKLVKRGTVLLVTKDSGSPLIWPISFLLVLSLCVTFYFPHRRVWVRFHDGRVQFAGLKEHFINVQRDFDSLALQIMALDKQSARASAHTRPKDGPPAKAAEKAGVKAAAARSSTKKAKVADETPATEAESMEQEAKAAEAEMEAIEAPSAEPAEASQAEEKKEVTAGD
jgi:cytochrome c biogenesis protein